MFKNFKKKFKNEKGLTLVELLAVIVILAILAVIAFVFIGGIIDNSKKDAHIANAQQVIAAAKLYETTETEIANAGMEIKDLQEKNYLEETIRDPYTKKSYDLKDTDLVKGSDDQYEITFKSDKCTISGKTEDDILADDKDRDEICPDN